VSRFNGDEDYPEYNNAWDLWNASVNRHLGGAKGQQALRDLRAALLALPEPRLIEGRLADERGCVCTVGALALHRRTTAGEPREKVLSDLASLIKPDERWNEIDAYESEERTIQCGRDIGLKMTMAVTLAARNDDISRDETPEQRFERVLAWVNERIFDEAAT